MLRAQLPWAQPPSVGVTTCTSGGVTENPGVEDVSGPSQGLVLSPVSVPQMQSFIMGAASLGYHESFTYSSDLGRVPSSIGLFSHL